MSEEPNAPITTEMPCPECSKNAELKVLKVDIPGEVASLISSLQCKNCQYKDNSIHDGDIGNGTGVFISCAFQNNDDIKRFVRLAEGSQVKVEKNGAKFEFTVTVSGVYVVESIIQDIISKYSVHTSVEETNEEGEKVMTKERAAKRLVILKDIIENPQFEMSISDNTGTSRIAPIGKMLRDIESDDMNLYNDERVRHAPFRVINRSG